MRKLALLAVFAASCSTESLKMGDMARKEFEAWAKAAVSGDAEKTFAGCSDANLSEWLFKRLEENDAIVRRWRGQLTGRPRTDLDLWWGISRRNGNGRAEVVSQNVLRDPSFAQLFRNFYMLTLDDIRTQFSRMEISHVYGDDTGVTIVAKMGHGPPMLVGLVFEDNRWKIDTTKEATGPGR